MSSTELQRKIFSRWVRQKVARRNMDVQDIVKDFSSGLLLVDLMEELSEKKCDKKFVRPPKMRVQQIDNINNALEFTWSCGVQLDLKPSAENLVDMNEKQILGLVWGIMRRFLKFGDDVDEKLNAQEALLMWVQNQTAGYKGVHVVDFGKSLHDGLALCALVHKFRPKLIGDFDSLDPSDKHGNIKKAMDAAEKYFGLEQYLQPSDISHLDDKSMVIYVSEYYYGIAAQRKIDLAGRRISKLVKFTKDNDAMKAEYNARAAKLRERVDRSTTLLNDRTIDNTLAGAKKRIEEFHEYKKNDKGAIVAEFLSLESLYNHLAMRLADHKRPAFVPAANQSVKDLRAALGAIEVAEQERSAALTAELNRQNRLVQLNEQHQNIFSKLYAWQAEKSNYLSTKETVESSGAAEFHLNALSAYGNECDAVKKSNYAELKRIGVTLREEKYENTATVQGREEKTDASFKLLEELDAKKLAVLKDDLVRNQFKEKVHVQNKSHVSEYQKLAAWFKEKDAFLEAKEPINSISDALEALANLDAYEKEKQNFAATNVPSFKAAGKAILNAKFKSDLSSWSFEKPQDVEDRHSSVDASLARLDASAAVKKQVLEQAHQLELKKEKTRLAFADVANNFSLFAKNTCDLLAASQFGFTLDEVRTTGEVLAKFDSETRGKCANDKTAYEAATKELVELGVHENSYTKLTVNELNTLAAAVEAALGERQLRYKAELARQQANDDLCRALADVVNPVIESVLKVKEQITNSQADLETQVAFCKQQLDDKTLGAKLPQAKSLQDQIDAAGVQYNRYSHNTAADAQGQYEQYVEFLKRKLQMLEEEIEHKKLRGVSKEQFAEIEAQFKQFDKNASGRLDRKEFKACLYSLGEERPNAEVDAIVQKYGQADGQVTHEGFTNFMVDLLGDTDTKDEIKNGFKLINRGAEVGKTDLLELILPQADVEYLVANSKQADGGIDYASWTEDVFSR